jgi:hypothetical protein
MDRTATRSVNVQSSVQASRWASHVAQVHRAERLAASAASSAGVPPAQYTVRKLAVAPHAARVLESQRAPAQLSLF